MFKAIQGTDHAILRTLARTFVRAGNNPAALLCLDHFFSSPLKLLNLSFIEVRALLSLYLDYVGLLNKFWYDGSLAEGSECQRLFGFQVLRENHYLVPEHTLLHEKLTNQSGSNRKIMEEYRCSSGKLRRGITQIIRSRAHDRTETQNGACRDVHGFSPCLRLLVENKCNSPGDPNGEGSCTFHHIQPEQLTVDWYHARLCLILLQFQILDLAHYHGLDVKKYVLAHSTRNACGYSLNVKLLAWDIVFSAPSAFAEARIVRES